MSTAWSPGAGLGAQVVRSESSQLTAAHAAVDSAKGDAGRFEGASDVLQERLEDVISCLTVEGPARLASKIGVAQICSLLRDTQQYMHNARQLSNTLQAALDRLMAIVQQLVQENSSLKAELSQVKAELSQVKAELSQVKAELSQVKAEQEQAVLLGQLVYVVDAAARGIVLQDINSSSSSSKVGAPGRRRLPFYTLPDLLRKKKDGELTSGQLANLQILEQVLQQRTGEPISDLVTRMQALRGGRAAAAHSTEQFRSTISAQQLRDWAEHAGVSSEDFETVLEAAQLFCEPEHPLVLTADLQERLAQVRLVLHVHTKHC